MAGIDELPKRPHAHGQRIEFERIQGDVAQPLVSVPTELAGGRILSAQRERSTNLLRRAAERHAPRGALDELANGRLGVIVATVNIAGLDPERLQQGNRARAGQQRA